MRLEPSLEPKSHTFFRPDPERLLATLVPSRIPRSTNVSQGDLKP